LDCIQSPRNPLLFKNLERIAAIKSIIFLVDKLFLAVNDVIFFKWLEVESIMTSTTKWDGIGFVVNEDMNLARVISEFSDGIVHNNTEKKKGGGAK
ncbi:hypothetical protein INT48_009903, partial [Thamnidium elegans]